MEEEGRGGRGGGRFHTIQTGILSTGCGLSYTHRVTNENREHLELFIRV